MRFADTRNGLWLGVIAVVLVAAALLLGGRAAPLLRQGAQAHLAARLPGVIGYGVGIIRELDVESPFDENGVSDTVTAHLTVRVNPTQGPAFTGTLDAVYAVADAEKLEVGSHGLVCYLRSDPENTVSIETRLPAEKKGAADLPLRRDELTTGACCGEQVPGRSLRAGRGRAPDRAQTRPPR